MTQRSYLANTDVAALRAIYGPPYAKKRVEIKYNRYWDEYGDYMSDATHKTYVDFYQDEACTIPAILPTRRYLNIYRYEQSGLNQGYTEKYTTLSIPSGVSSYYIGDGSKVIHEIQGSLVEYSIIEYSIINI